MNSTAATTFGPTATAGAAARIRWSATEQAFGARHHAAAISSMPSSVLVKKDTNGIYHRPPEVST